MESQGEKAKSIYKPAKQIIIEALREAGGSPLTVSELVRITGLNRNTIRGRLVELKRKGIVEHVRGGWTLKSKE